MLEARLRSYRTHTRLVNRSADLLAMEGWYNVKSEDPHFSRYLKSGSKLSFSRWLLKTERLGTIEVSRIAKKVASENTSIKISCRFNDLLRAADSPHYISCLAPNHLGHLTAIKLVRNPNVAIIYTPDSGGFFLGRAIFILKNRYIKIFRCYGTFTHPMLTRFFKKNFPQYAVYEYEDDIISYMLDRNLGDYRN